jgi:hypothetical protein
MLQNTTKFPFNRNQITQITKQRRKFYPTEYLIKAMTS